MSKLPRYGSLTEKVLDEKDRHILTLRWLLGLMVAVCVFMWIGWNNAPKDLRIHIPPDLRAGSTRFVNEIDDFNVYAYALMMSQRLYRWEKNGEEDYFANIYQYKNYITNDFFNFLLKDFEEKRAARQLSQRTRLLQEIPGQGFSFATSHDRVVIESDHSWIVYLDVQIVEEYAGGVIKDLYMRYPLRIIRSDIGVDLNPWGLMIDGFVEAPKRIVYKQDE